MRGITLTVVAAGLAMGLSGCWSSPDVRSGTYEGATKLSRVYYGSDRSDPIAGGSGEIAFRSRDALHFGDTTPLPNCNVSITELKEGEYMITSSTQFRGESNDGLGCRARLPHGLEFPATVEGRIKRRPDGGIDVTALFYRKDSPDSGQFQLEFAGERKGWF